MAKLLLKKHRIGLVTCGEIFKNCYSKDTSDNLKNLMI